MVRGRHKGLEIVPAADGRVPRHAGERLMALVQPHSGAHRIVRRAWRSAQRLGAELDVLWRSNRGDGEARR